MNDDVALIVRRVIRAPAERLFEAWTQPEALQRWWGPKGVTCISAEVDLRVGGLYRIGHQLPDGVVLWISGAFEEIERPRKLVYSWLVEAPGALPERVTVRFDAHAEGTEVIVIHERIPDQKTRETHEYGWVGCLEGLDRFSRDEAELRKVLARKTDGA